MPPLPQPLPAPVLGDGVVPEGAEHRDRLLVNVPRFECPDADLQRVYYFRWEVFHKHLRETPDGYVVTEFLPPVSWAGLHNTISCAAALHFCEGRWLADQGPLDDYATFWFRRGGDPVRYSFWAAHALYQRYLVTGDAAALVDLLPDLIANLHVWETGWEPKRGWTCGDPRLDANGLYWQVDTCDGMEFSISGSGYRPTINSYMYGDLRAIAAIALLAGDSQLAAHYTQRAAGLRRLVHEQLWDPEARFFKTRVNAAGARPHYEWQRYAPRHWQAGELADVRELVGYLPWYTHLAEPGLEDAWLQLIDPEGFQAPYGPTTAEQRHPSFLYPCYHDCLWNGYSWPFATTQTLVALANLLNDYDQSTMTARHYLDLLQTYARSHRRVLEDGTTIPWIDENLHPHTGDWDCRTRLFARGETSDRGKDYNHSGFCDLVISGLVGIRPQADDRLTVHPLVPTDTWAWFCLDRVPYRGHWLTVLWDQDGTRYDRGRGLRVFADGVEVAAADTLCRISLQLPTLTPVSPS